MIGIKINVDDRQLTAAIGRLRRKIGDLTPALNEAGELVKLSIKRNFEDEGRPDTWKKSARATAEGGQTLSDRATLRNSFTHDASPDRLIVGTNVRYAAIHHFGGKIKAKNGKALNTPFGPRRSITMPARPFMLLQEGDRLRILTIVKRYLSG